MICRRNLLLLALAVAAGASRPAAGAVLDVGVGQAYATIGAAVAAAQAGDTIDIFGGTYTDQSAIINVPLTIQGVDGTPVFTATTDLSNGKAFLIVNASTTIDNIAFENATDSSANGAGIRYQSGDLIVSNSTFQSDQDGILATPFVAKTGSVLVENSTFLDDGIASGPYAGGAHGIYATDVASLTVEDSVFSGTQAGHDIKSRAVTTLVSGNTLDDGVTGTTSYAVDISNGGNATIIGNTITQGPNTQNESMVAYDTEGLLYADNSLLVEGNSFSNTLQGLSIGVYNHDAALTADITCNAFDGLSEPVVGPARLTGNAINGPLPACPAPEPSTAALLLSGMLLLIGVAPRRARNRSGAWIRKSG